VVSFDVSPALKATASVLVVVALGMPSASFSQRGAQESTIEALQERIRGVEAREGPNSAGLIAPLTELGIRYQEDGSTLLAAAATQRALEVVRFNHGLYTLEQAPLIRLLIRNLESLGEHEAAWDFEQEILRLAERHPDDLRTARILRDTAERRKDILERYDAGEFPPEIVLGCYLARWDANGQYTSDASMDSGARPTNGNGCASGSRFLAKRRLVGEVQAYYSQSIDIIIRNEHYATDELRTLVFELAESSYRYENLALGRRGLGPGSVRAYQTTSPESSYRDETLALGRRSLNSLLGYQTKNSEPLLTRIETLVQIADWDLVYSDTRDGKESALAQYGEALKLLKEEPVAQASIDRLFSPEIPIALPAFLPNPLITSDVASTGHIDVAFEVDKYGRSRRFRILDRTNNSTVAAEKRLEQLIKRSHFRPKLINGQFADTAPIVVRYYLNE
jgi:hypothetical protein